MRWFEDNGLAVPQPEQMEVFVGDGIVLLPSGHRDQRLSCDPKSFASIAVTACINEATSQYAGHQVCLKQL
ncbi:hypothetical protein [Methylobacterium brachiatum]